MESHLLSFFLSGLSNPQQLGEDVSCWNLRRVEDRVGDGCDGKEGMDFEDDTYFDLSTTPSLDMSAFARIIATWSRNDSLLFSSFQRFRETCKRTSPEMPGWEGQRKNLLRSSGILAVTAISHFTFHATKIPTGNVFSQLLRVTRPRGEEGKQMRLQTVRKNGVGKTAKREFMRTRKHVTVSRVH